MVDLLLQVHNSRNSVLTLVNENWAAPHTDFPKSQKHGSLNDMSYWDKKTTKKLYRSHLQPAKKLFDKVKGSVKAMQVE